MEQAMLRVVIISPDQELGNSAVAACSGLDGVRVLRTLGYYPEVPELLRVLRVYVPQVVLLNVGEQRAVASLVETIRAEAPGVQLVGIHHDCTSDLLLDLMRLGIQEFVGEPFETDMMLDCFGRVRYHLAANPVALRGTDLVYSFLPAKPGVGTTTLAVNIAAAASRVREDRVFLGDFDLNSGLVRFNLKLETALTVLDATQRAGEVDENSWAQLVTSFGSLDVMHSGRVNPLSRIEAVQLRYLLDYLRKAYRVVCADLSGNMEKFSLELMHESKQIFLVTTPELPALHLAREKYQFLCELELGDRVCLLLNRTTKNGPLQASDVEEIVGKPVFMSFPNDYRAVHESVSAGTFIRKTSPVSGQCSALASALLEGVPQKSKAQSRKFVEYFSLVPALYRMQRG